MHKTAKLFILSVSFNIFFLGATPAIACYSVKDCLPLAEKGNVFAQLQLGKFYKSGTVYNTKIPKDNAAALKWYQAAASQGSIDAHFWLGEIHESGTGVSQNKEKARQYFLIAARNENTKHTTPDTRHHVQSAQVRLGIMFLNGENITDNKSEAIEWMSQAAKWTSNHQIKIAVAGEYFRGDRIPKDVEQTLYWLNRAAEIDKYVEAYVISASIYEEGAGVLQDLKRASDLYFEAARRGHLEAQYAMGRLAYEGKGESQSNVGAYAWFNIAAAQGHEDARKYRDEALKKLSSQELEEAKNISQKYMKQFVKH